MSRSVLIDLMHVVIVFAGITYIVKNKQDFKNSIMGPVKKIAKCCDQSSQSSKSN